MWNDGPLFDPGDAAFNARLDKVIAAMKAREIDGLLLLKHESVRYVSGFYTKGYRPFLDFDYVALVRPGHDTVVGYALGGEDRRIARRSRVRKSFRLPPLKGWGPGIEQLIIEEGFTQGRLAFDLLPHFVFGHLSAALPGLELVDASEIWADTTATKCPEELPVIERALEVAQAGVAAALEAIEPGVTEIAVSAAGEERMRLLGSEMNPFIPVVSSGINAAIWERVATHKPIGEGEMVILDFGSVIDGYTGDSARTTVVGTPTAEQRAIYRAAYDALNRSIEAVKPGVLCSEIAMISQRTIEDAGFARYAQPWAVGHQLGFGLHGTPVLAAGVDVPIEPGMVINIEPSIYTYDDLTVGGVEIEDSILVEDGGVRLLTNLPYDQALLS
ncbi:MAG: aminopeptidase P family protein [Thermomicrobiales bacterium]|nr:aminopeptidase P family protein [Thermomicrobiales bacterium]